MGDFSAVYQKPQAACPFGFQKQPFSRKIWEGYFFDQLCFPFESMLSGEAGQDRLVRFKGFRVEVSVPLVKPLVRAADTVFVQRAGQVYRVVSAADVGLPSAC